LQIFVLVVTGSFIGYLVIQIICTFTENYFISLKVDKLFPYLKQYRQAKLSKIEKKDIWINVKALLIYKLGSKMLDGSDNIIISAFIGLTWVGIYSNYVLIVGSMSLLLSQFTKAISASVGNFVVKENTERQEFLLKTITLANFFLYGISFVCLSLLLNPFIQLWLGDEYLLDNRTVFVISLNWYIFGMMNSIWNFRSSMGLFVYGKYRPAISAIINIVVSIFLAKNMGLFGVLLGTTLTRIVTNVWFDPLIVYKYGFNKSAKNYYMKWLKYVILVLGNLVIVTLLSSFLTETTIIVFLIKLLICISIPLTTFMLILHKTEEFEYLFSMVRSIGIKNKKIKTSKVNLKNSNS
jgi:O-antigen/teichoic acid export membrane protein